jgi:hypothetical protein
MTHPFALLIDDLTTLEYIYDKFDEASQTSGGINFAKKPYRGLEGRSEWAICNPPLNLSSYRQLTETVVH